MAQRATDVHNKTPTQGGLGPDVPDGIGYKGAELIYD